MRCVSRIALGGLLAVFAMHTAAAQDEPIAFDQVYQLVAGNQLRAAVHMMSVVSVDFRKELGRCHDEQIGGRMMQTEPKIDALGAKMAAGGVTSAGVLAKDFGEFDHLLAEHHQQLAAEAWSRQRTGTMPAIARDLGLAAQYLARAGRWHKQPLSADAQKAVDNAIAVAKRLAADPGNPPSDTKAAIDALGTLVRRPAQAPAGGSE
jgi:hypothetical protein